MALPYSLRGDDNKQKFVADYKPTCIWRSILFNNDTERCCCGNELTDEYFIFSFIQNAKNETFSAGSSCGKKLLEYANLPLPPKFNPFILENAPDINNANTKNAQNLQLTVNNADRIHQRPLNNEMVTAISLLLFFWKKKEGRLNDILITLKEHPHWEPRDNEIKTLNKAIGTTIKNNNYTSLREMLTLEARKNNIVAREYQFPLLEQKLIKLDEISFL